jgi:predicted site-specific integrase-resolvase
MFAKMLHLQHNYTGSLSKKNHDLPASPASNARVLQMSHTGQVIGYIRVSTDDQPLSAEAQRHRLREWCWANGLELVAIYEDVGVSGGWPLEKRPGILDAIRALQPGMVLLATKRDRLARDTMFTAKAIRAMVQDHAA